MKSMRGFSAVAGLAMLAVPVLIGAFITTIGTAPSNLISAAPMQVWTSGPANDPNEAGQTDEPNDADKDLHPSDAPLSEPPDEPVSRASSDRPITPTPNDENALIPPAPDAPATEQATQQPQVDEIGVTPVATPEVSIEVDPGDGPRRSGANGESTARDLLDYQLGISGNTTGGAVVPATDSLLDIADYSYAPRDVINGQLFPGVQSAIGAYNANAGVCSFVGDGGVVVLPHRYDPVAPQWMATLRLESIGDRRQHVAVSPAVAEASGNELTLDHGVVTEWYKNRHEGLEHGFVVHARPGSMDGADDESIHIAEGELRLELSVATNLLGEVADGGRSIRFLHPNGVVGFWYRSLHASDATGRDLAARMECGPGRVSIVIDAAGAKFPIEIDPTIMVPWQTINDNGANLLGTSVAINRAGTLLAIGVPRKTVGQATHTGTVQIFELVGVTWTLQREVSLGNLPFYAEAALGTSVDVVDGFVVAGAPTYQSADSGGGVLVIKKGASWAAGSTTDTVMRNQSPWFLNNGLCGNSVSISDVGNARRIAVGVPGFDSYVDSTTLTDSGLVNVVTEQPDGSWGQTQYIEPAVGSGNQAERNGNKQRFASFGWSVSLSGDSLLIGSPGYDGNINQTSTFDYGRVYTYSRTGTSWGLLGHESRPDNQEVSDNAGWAVAIDSTNDSAFYSVPFGQEPGDPTNCGIVFQISRLTGFNGTRATLANATANDNFGRALALTGNRLVAGVPQNTSATTASGKIVVMRSDFTNRMEFVPSAANDSLTGWAVDAAASGVVVAGAPGRFNPAPAINGRTFINNVGYDCDNGGSIDFPEPYTDCNGNGAPDQCDLQTGSALDCNGNGVPDSCDISNGTSPDCNANGVPDSCDVSTGAAADCNGNAVPDSCDIADATSLDNNANGVPDECETGPTGSDALSLDGVDDYVDVPDAAYFDGGPFTVEAWVRPDAHGSWQRVVDFGNGAPSNNIILSASSGTSGRPSASIYVGTTAYTLTAPTADAIPLKEWSHLAVTYSGGANGTLRLYVNGVEVNSRTANAPINITRTGCYIGRSNWGADAYFKGLIDDVRIWNVRRSASEISGWRRRPPAGNETGLVSYWRFDEGIAATSVVDSVGSSAGTRMNGATRWQSRETDYDGDGIIDLVDIQNDRNSNGLEDSRELESTFFGLLAQTYDGFDVATPGPIGVRIRTRIDPTVNFAWGTGPGPWQSQSNGFTVAWTGYVIPPVSGDYRFFTEADNTERLYVNNQLLIDSWVLGSTGEMSSPVISLQAGVLYKIRLEYGEDTGGATAILRWRPPGGSKGVIPAWALRPARDCNSNGIPDDRGSGADVDADGDGVINTCDNCDLTPNPEQTDANGDGVGDACSGGDVYLADALQPPAGMINPQSATVSPTNGAFYHTVEQKWYANWQPTLTPVVVTWQVTGGTQQLTYNVTNSVNPNNLQVSDVRYHANPTSDYPNLTRPLPVLQNNYNLLVRANTAVSTGNVTTQTGGAALADPACVPTAGSTTVKTLTIASAAFPASGQTNKVILEYDTPGTGRLVGFEVVSIAAFTAESEQVPIGRKLLPPNTLSYTCRARVLVNSVAVPGLGALPVAFQRRATSETGDIWPLRPNSDSANFQVMWFSTSSVVNPQSGDSVFLGHWPEQLKTYTTRWPATANGDAPPQINVISDVPTAPVSLVDLRLEGTTALDPLYCAATDIVMWDGDASNVERGSSNTSRTAVVNGRFVAKQRSRTVLKLTPYGESCSDPDHVTFEVVESYVRGTEPGFNATPTNWNVGTPITDTLHNSNTPDYPFGYLHQGKPYAPKVYYPVAPAGLNYPGWPTGTPSDEYTGQIIPIAESNTTLWNTAQDLIDRRLEVWYFDASAATIDGNFAGGLFWPYRTKVYNLRWQTNLPTTRNIVIASRIGVGIDGIGDGDFSDYDDVRLYRSGVRTDNETVQKTQAGWNGNDEHADFQPIGTGERLFATRDDNPWNVKIGHPYALVYYKNNADDVWQTRVFKVVGEQSPYTFHFSQSFSPGGGTTDLLPGIPLNPPLFPINYNIAAPNPCAPGNPEVTLLGDQNLNPLWRDKNEQLWIRAPGPGGVRFEEFWGRDGETACTPWRDFRSGNGTTVTFDAQMWPADCAQGGSTPCAIPVGIGDTIDPFPVCSIEQIWDEADNANQNVHPRLIDPDLEASASYTALPPDFGSLPPHIASGTNPNGVYLEDRIGYDAANLALTYRGIMSYGEWQTLRTENAPAGWLPTPAFIASVDELYDNSRVQITDPDFDVTTLSAPKISFGTADANPGYVTFAYNNESSANCAGYNVAVPIFHVTCPPVAPSVEAFYTQCIFGETVTLRVSNDGGGEPENLAYQWQYREIGSNDWRNVNGVNDGYEIGLRSLVLKGSITLADRDYRVRYRGYSGCPCGGENEPPCPTVDNGGNDPNDWPFATSGSVPTASGNAPPGQTYSYGATSPSAWSGAVHTDGWLKRIVGKLNLFNTPIPVDLDTDGNRLVTALTAVQRVGAPYEGVVSLGCDDSFLSQLGLLIGYESAADRVKLFTVAQRVATVAESLALMFINGHIANLYMIAGNEAASDAADPTNGIDPQSAGDPAGLPSNRFAFEGEVPDLLSEELSLLRGTGQTAASPLWNRLRWNFNVSPEGQAAYVSTYNITSAANITLEDAQLQWPQGHGDAWGHFLDGVKKYYDLLRDDNFEWIIINEYIDDTPISYENERRFARLAAAKARTGAQIVDLTFRDRYTGDPDDDPAYPDPSDADRAWGVEDWARRAGQGALLDWVTINALVDDNDDIPAHQGNIRKVDRTTIGELGELAGAYAEVQTTLDNAGSGRTPFGLASNAVPFGIDPAALASGQSHYEQVRCWAVKQLQNAQTIFDFANTINTRLRRNEDASQDFQAAVQLAEIDRLQRLIEIFGRPYPEAITDPGGYPSDYEGPDVVYWMVVDSSDLLGGTTAFQNSANTRSLSFTLTDPVGTLIGTPTDGSHLDNFQGSFPFTVSTIGYGVVKPSHWTQRPEPGEIQIARSEVLVAIGELQQSINAYEAHIGQIRTEVSNWEAIVQTQADVLEIREGFQSEERRLLTAIATLSQFATVARDAAEVAWNLADAIAEASPSELTDVTSFVRGSAKGGGVAAQAIALAVANLFEIGQRSAENELQFAGTTADIDVLREEQDLEETLQLNVIKQLIRETSVLRAEVYTKVEELNQATGRYQSTVGRGLRLLDEVKVNRQLDVISANDYRYRDYTFRLLRNDALQKYRAMFDVAARYTFLAARAFDYETNLLPDNPDSAQNAVRAIARARMIGAPPDAGFSCSAGATLPTVVGDNGLSGILGELDQIFQTYRINRDTQALTQTFSIRNDLFGATDSSAWKSMLTAHIVPNVKDIREFDAFAALPNPYISQPALVIPFQTTIQDGLNFFALQNGGDTFASSYDAVKFLTVKIAVPNLPTTSLSRTTVFAYLIPVGSDAMWAPTPAGHQPMLRFWNLIDQALPIPRTALGFTQPTTSLNDIWTPADTLTGGAPATAARRRLPPIDARAAFGAEPANDALLGRSIWNTQWMLIIPSNGLSALPLSLDRKLEIFINGSGSETGVSDIQLLINGIGYESNIGLRRGDDDPDAPQTETLGETSK